MQQRAKDVVAWRCKQRDKVKEKKDQIVIEERAAEHRKEYLEKRKVKLERGWRVQKRATEARKKESAADLAGPRLSVVIKGFCFSLCWHATL